MATYLCSKLDDHYTVSTAALPGLNLLLGRQSSNNESGENCISRDKSLRIIKSILKEVHVQSLIQPDRNLIFNMTKFFLASPNLVDLVREQNYETDFVYGVIQAIDGEKDPRNLLVSFECIRSMCAQLSLGPFVEETYEVFACYFPIDFTPVKFKFFFFF